MAERKQLSQSQARLLFRSLKPFEKTRKTALKRLEEIETTYTGFKLKKPPFENELPVEAILEHEDREKVFMIDIPYSRDALDEIDQKVDEIKQVFDAPNKDVFFAAVDTFKEGKGSNYIYSLDELENEISETAGVISPEKVAELFTPKVSTEKTWEDGYLEVNDTRKLGFRLRVYTEDDYRFKVEAQMSRKAVEEMKERMMNSRKDLGDLEGKRFRLEFKITEDGLIKYSGKEKSLQNFKDEVRTVYQSSVNPVLSKNVKATVD